MGRDSKLSEEQQILLLEWLSRGYNNTLIRALSSKHNVPILSHAAYLYYRNKYRISLESIAKKRRSTALSIGYAVKEERIVALVEHAYTLESEMEKLDRLNRPYNESPWRKTLAQIREEVEGDASLANQGPGTFIDLVKSVTTGPIEEEDEDATTVTSLDDLKPPTDAVGATLDQGIYALLGLEVDNDVTKTS